MRRMLPLLALLLATPAQAEWWEAKTEHFLVYSQDSQAKTKAFVLELERFDHALRSLQAVKFQPVKSDSQRVVIYRTGDIDAIGRLAHRDGVAGFYQPRMNPAAFTPVKAGNLSQGSIVRRDSRTNMDARSVLFHEYAHHFMFQYFAAAYPSWYVEAFAETVATIDLKPDGSFHVGNPPQYRTDALFNYMMTVTPKSLLASTSKPTTEDFYGYYSMGWLMNHYLQFGSNRAGELKNYLRLVNGGMDSAPAAKQAFGDIDKLNSEIIKYKSSGRLGGAVVRPPTAAPSEVEMRKLGADEEAAMRIRVRSKAGVTKSEIPGVAADSRAVTRAYPGSYLAHLQLSEAEFDGKNYDAAEAAANRALQINPQSVEALVRKAQIGIERGKKDKAQLAVARESIQKAFEIDPYNPEILFLNYMTYFESGEPVPERAIIGLETAYDNARQDARLRLVLGRQLLIEKKGSLAKDILMPLGLDPHESKDQKKMRDIIDKIGAGKVEEARDDLIKEMKKQEDEAEKGS